MPLANKRFNADLGLMIMKYRIVRGLTQEQLAEKLNTKKATISRYERGQRQPRLEQLIKIADALGVSVMDLIRSLITILLEENYYV